MSNSARPNDVIIIGATAFVGSRFTKYYAPYFAERGLKVLATGRNQEKLASVLDGLPGIQSAILDLNDAAAVDDIVRTGRLVVNFAGPFDRYAEPVVAACARHGVHYLDITGEVYFARRMIDRYEEQAQASGALLVPFVGFDSIPSDYGVYLARKKAAISGTQLKSADTVFALRGGFNGGTALTALDMAQTLTPQDSANRHYLTDLNPKLQKDSQSARLIPETGRWVAPFLMESINTKIVYRSVALSHDPAVSDDFDYRESMASPGGHLGNALVSQTLRFSDGLLRRSWGRKIAGVLLPKPGAGPSDESIEKGWAKANIFARMEDGSAHQIQFSSKGDPGNKTTLKLIGSAMKCVLENGHEGRKGFLTPSTAFGDRLLPLMEAEGIHFKDVSRSERARSQSQTRSG